VPLHILARQAIIVLDGDRHVADALDAIPPRSLPRPDTPPTGTVSSLGAAQSDNPPDTSDMMPPDASRSIPTSNGRRWTGADRARGQRGPFAGRGLIARSWVRVGDASVHVRARQQGPEGAVLRGRGRPTIPERRLSANVSSRQDWPSAAMHSASPLTPSTTLNLGGFLGSGAWRAMASPEIHGEASRAKRETLLKGARARNRRRGRRRSLTP
jgi:hypothetical protein